MLAAADYAEGYGNGGMPAELDLALQCDQWGALPESGGLLDQPLGLVARMGAALNVYRAVSSSVHRGKMNLVDWSNQNPTAWKVLATVEKMRRG